MPKRYTIMIAIVLVGIVALVSSFKAEARSARCGHHSEVTQFLKEKYHETRVGMGLINAGQMMELYISERGTWTMLITRPDGVTCFGPVGKSWTHIKAKPVENDPA